MEHAAIHTPTHTEMTHSKKSTSPSPGLLYVLKRDETTRVRFDPNKIALAITKAFLAQEGSRATASSRVHDIVQQITQEIEQILAAKTSRQGDVTSVEDIQNLVESKLMEHRHFHVAKHYILYREQRRQAREKARKNTQQHSPTSINVALPDGRLVPLDMVKLQAYVEEACAHVTDVAPSVLVQETLRNLFDGISLSNVRTALVMVARTRIEQEPNYSYVAANLLLQQACDDALSFLGLPLASSQAEMAHLYPMALQESLTRGVALERLNPALLGFDLERLGAALTPERDRQFTYLSLQTLYDRYFIHENDIRYELPQVFFMRVAMGLALEEEHKEERAIEFYNLIASFDYMSSTPTLFNSGTTRSQLSSCYLTTIGDDLDDIYDSIRKNALLSKFAGGLGNDWSSVRAMNALIKGTNGRSQGVVPFLKVANDTAVAVNQGGKRKGAVCAYLETWHLDIEEFLELRKNTGDDRRRTHDMNTANWVPDLFMMRMMENKEWTLFSPDETPDLHDTYGLAFQKAYEAYEALADAGKIRNFKRLPAVKLWRKMLGMLFETGHPWVTFKDPCNLRSPQQHVGVVHSSNLCTEITLNTSKDEIAVCNLGSINLPAHITAEGTLDVAKLRTTITTATRMLDNVIDINYYSVSDAKNSNLKHRPIGLGLMGFQDMLYKMDIPYASPEAVALADTTMETISYYAIEASMLLAKERGAYATYPGSLWDQGILPIDSIEHLAAARGSDYLELDRSQTMPWDDLRASIQQHGMRNSNVMAIAPTATISNICGVTQSIEPTFQNLFVKSNLSGEFTMVNPYLVADLKAEDLWDPVMVNDLKYYDGSVQPIDRIPERIKKKYATAFELDASWLVEAAARRQKWIDQSQSLNLYMAKPSGKKLDGLYRLAFLRGLKTTYYLRTLGASDPEKSTLNRSKLNAVQATSTASICSIDNPDCEACQ